MWDEGLWLTLLKTATVHKDNRITFRFKNGTDITVTCKDVTAQLNIYIHDLTSETMPANDYPESSHNYEDNLDKTYTYTADGAYSLDVTFSNETEAETNIDYIYVNGTKYTGS